MDDGGIVGSVELLKKVWEILKVAPLGLVPRVSRLLRRTKSKCGVPLGSQESVEKFVKRELLGTAEGVMNKLLHPVMKSLKQAAQQGDVEQMEAICAMFDLRPLPEILAEDQTESKADSLGVAQLSTLTA